MLASGTLRQGRPQRGKTIQEAFAWIKDFAGLKRTILLRRRKITMQKMMAVAVYNLARMKRLLGQS